MPQKKKLITRSTQFGKHKKLLEEIVDLPAVEADDGSMAQVLVCELTYRKASRYEKSLRKYDDNGRYIGQDLDNADAKQLWAVCQDGNGNSIWPTLEDAIAELNEWGQSSINLLLAASNRVNSGESRNPVSDEDLEKNSETAQTNS